MTEPTDFDASFEEAEAPSVLVVDDSPIDQRLAGGIVEKRLDADIEFASDGAEALTAIERKRPDLVLTDLQMPKMDGLELVYLDLIEERRNRLPYKDRHIFVHASLTRDEAVIRVRDEGPGFDASTVTDPTDLSRIDKSHGRGLLLIHTFMDAVRFNVAGNEITMIKKRDVY
jgi:CheY-like chemotaxis protein